MRFHSIKEGHARMLAVIACCSEHTENKDRKGIHVSVFNRVIRKSLHKVRTGIYFLRCATSLFICCYINKSNGSLGMGYLWVRAFLTCETGGVGSIEESPVLPVGRNLREPTNHMRSWVLNISIFRTQNIPTEVLT